MLVLLSALCIPHSAFAPLTARVTPGYVYGTSERPTTSTLNRLGQPTIEVTGTLDGTAGITAGTITGTLLSDTVVDDRTINFTNSSPRSLQIKPFGVNTNEISTALAGNGLGGGGGFPLSNKVDGLTITITNDTLTLQTNLPLGLLNVTSNYVVVGTTNNVGTAVSLLTFGRLLVAAGGTLTNTAEFTIAGGLICDVPHYLGVTPTTVRTVIICKTADLGYLPGDEISADAIVSTAGGIAFQTSVNTTNISVVCYDVADIRALVKPTGDDSQAIVNSRWRVKIYARP